MEPLKAALQRDLRAVRIFLKNLRERAEGHVVQQGPFAGVRKEEALPKAEQLNKELRARLTAAMRGRRDAYEPLRRLRSKTSVLGMSDDDWYNDWVSRYAMARPFGKRQSGGGHAVPHASAGEASSGEVPRKRHRVRPHGATRASAGEASSGEVPRQRRRVRRRAAKVLDRRLAKLEADLEDEIAAGQELETDNQRLRNEVRELQAAVDGLAAENDTLRTARSGRASHSPASTARSSSGRSSGSSSSRPSGSSSSRSSGSSLSGV